MTYMIQTASRFAAAYVLQRLIFRIGEFLRRWYVASGVGIAHAAIRRLESLDRTFALKITLLHFFTPLYGDESFIGRIFGVLFRSVRIVIALALYLMIAVLALLAYLIWALIPVYFLAKAVMG